MALGFSQTPWSGMSIQGGSSWQANEIPETQLWNHQKQMAQIPYDFQKWKMGQILPLIQGQMGGGPSTIGGDSGPSPEITVGPIWNQQQIQQRVNQMRAGNDATTQGQVSRNAQSLAGRGFGTNSPLAHAMQQQAQNANLMANTRGENDLRWQAAQGNAGHVLNTQQAREQQFAQRQQEQIERQKPYYQYQSALLAALASM